MGQSLFLAKNKRKKGTNYMEKAKDNEPAYDNFSFCVNLIQKKKKRDHRVTSPVELLYF